MIGYFKDPKHTILQKVNYSIGLKDKDLKHLFKNIPVNIILEMFDIYEMQTKSRMFKLLDDHVQKTVIHHMANDDLVDFIKSSENLQAKVFSFLDTMKRHRIEILMNYHETKTGSLMSNDFLVFDESDTAGETLRRLIHDTKHETYIDDVFVLDASKQLVGRITLSSLVIARKNTPLKDIMKPIIIRIQPESELTYAINLMMDYDKMSVPVLDSEGHMVGIITADDVLEEVVENFDNDFKGLAQVQNIETYDSGFTRYLKRMPWLLMALVFKIIIALFLGVFEETIAAVTALVLFQPLILNMSGNIATQSLAVTLLHDENTSKKHMLREINIGVLNGLLMSILTFILSVSFLSILNYNIIDVLFISTQVSLALWVAIIVAAMIGVLIPMVLIKFKKDATIASGPLITTLNDLIALSIYFTIATLFLL
jgi:magnesium transporter